MRNFVVRGGLIVDGTGSPGKHGDIAVDDGIITAVGGKTGPGAREVDADGLLVTLGFVDIHTHYDGQTTWDPILRPRPGTASPR
jgi:N-acyl-D-amino-acid deacylase